MTRSMITAGLHPRHLTATRVHRERERIAARYAPSARELFAHREAVAAGASVLMTTAQERAVERRARRVQRDAYSMSGRFEMDFTVHPTSAFRKLATEMFGGDR